MNLLASLAKCCKMRLFKWFLDTIFESLKETGKGWCVTLILLSIFYECQVWTTSHFEAIRVVKHHFLRGCPFYHLPDLTTYRVQNMPFIQKHLRNKSYTLYENYQKISKREVVRFVCWEDVPCVAVYILEVNNQHA